MEDNLKHNLEKSTLIGCDIIVNNSKLAHATTTSGVLNNGGEKED
jgi:hypothetical protein